MPLHGASLQHCWQLDFSLREMFSQTYLQRKQLKLIK